MPWRYLLYWFLAGPLQRIGKPRSQDEGSGCAVGCELVVVLVILAVVVWWVIAAIQQPQW